MGIVEEIDRAREAFERHEWAAAYERLSHIDPDLLGPEDLSALATAAYLLGDNDACVRAMQRAFHMRSNAGDTLGAVRCATWIAMVLITGGDFQVGGGWVARAQRLLESQPDDVVERGYMLIHAFFQHVGNGDFPKAVETGVEILGIGQRFKDPDLIAMGLMCQGRCLLYGGRVPEGLALLDEAMVGVAAGEVSPIFAGQIYCSMIEACQEISDFGRVQEWTSALTRWCDAQPDLIPFTGQCALHRAQIMRFHGAFAEALDELDLAQRRYLLLGAPAAAGLAWCERGDVLRIRGDYSEAEAAYDRAAGHGHEPQPGLALLWLARGRTSTAVGAIQRLLAETHDPVHRTKLLPAAVEIELIAGDVAGARAAADELTGIASSFGCAALQACGAYAAGSVNLHTGEHTAALAELRRASNLWSGLDSPYDAARARVQLGRVFRAMGDEESANTELLAAQRAFQQLAAAPAAREVAKLHQRDTPGGLTARQMEVLRLVATGKSNPQIAAELVISEKTVARHLSSIFQKIDVSSRTAAAVYAFEHELI